MADATIIFRPPTFRKMPDSAIAAPQAMISPKTLKFLILLLQLIGVIAMMVLLFS